MPTSDSMKLKYFVSLIALSIVAFSGPVSAQTTAKVPRIGYLIVSTPTAIADRLEAFRQGLNELGYVEGKNVVIDQRWADGKLDRMAELAAELLRLNVDIILSTGPQSTRVAKEATSTTPIVMGFDNDPVGNGFVASLARPGGNITGLSTLAPEISGKQLELLKETVPRLSRVAVLGTSTQPGSAQSLKEIELAAKKLGVKVQFLDIPSAKEMAAAFGAAGKGRAEAVIVINSPVFNSPRTQVTELAAKNRLPAIYWATEFIDAGGLMTYSVSFTHLFRRAATYIDKILKGRKPAELPVEQPIKFEFVVNLKAAKQIGVTIPPNVLARADRVIK